jgi:hypothetical protein
MALVGWMNRQQQTEMFLERMACGAGGKAQVASTVFVRLKARNRRLVFGRVVDFFTECCACRMTNGSR